jgi:hypothetical protein
MKIKSIKPGTPAQVRLVIGYLAVAALLPYLLLKLAWIGGSTIGIIEQSPVDDAILLAGNILTAALEVAAAVIILAFTHNWGLRVPAWLVLLPVWVGMGLLAPFIVTGPVVAVSLLTDAAPVGNGSLAPWVGLVVYLSFGAQALGITAAFVLYARARWPRVLGSRVGVRRAGPTQPVLVLAAWVAIGLLVVVAAARLQRALGSTAGLSPDLVAGRGVAQQLGDAGLALFATVAALGLLNLVHRCGAQTPAWLPLTFTWVGSGAVWAGGLYPMVLLLVGTAGGGTSGDEGLLAGVEFVQVIAGVVTAMTGAILLAELHHATAGPMTRGSSGHREMAASS